MPNHVYFFTLQTFLYVNSDLNMSCITAKKNFFCLTFMKLCFYISFEEKQAKIKKKVLTEIMANRFFNLVLLQITYRRLIPTRDPIKHQSPIYPLLFINPLDVLIDPWESISTTLRSTAVDTS